MCFALLVSLILILFVGFKLIIAEPPTKIISGDFKYGTENLTCTQLRGTWYCCKQWNWATVQDNDTGLQYNTTDCVRVDFQE